jgi:serine/threonine protein kinase
MSLSVRPAVPGVQFGPRFTDLALMRAGRRFRHLEARDVATGRRVVLTTPANPNAAWTSAALDRAATVHARIGAHPHVLTMFERLVGSAGVPALVVERCSGSLAEVSGVHRPSVRAAVAIGLKLCGALETLHAAGFVHTDVRPANVYVSEWGEPLLAGFADAVAVDAGGPEHPLHGTRPHTAPEVIEGAAATPATDVYGLAVTLYELLAGHPAYPTFGGERPSETSLRILRGARPALPPSVPLALADTLEWAMHADPAQRPPSAAWLAEDLRRFERVEGWPRTARISA